MTVGSEEFQRRHLVGFSNSFLAGIARAGSDYPWEHQTDGATATEGAVCHGCGKQQ
jgi:hypothetical protein